MERKPADYIERTYRQRIFNDHLKKFNVTVRETDLFICADDDLSEAALRSVHRHRAYIEAYIRGRPEFRDSLLPLPYDPFAPPIVREMMAAALRAGVGPMAAVAGAVAERVGLDLLPLSGNVIVENGGDLFLHADHDLRIGIFAGGSPFSERISLRVGRAEMPLGVCTSSGTVGHSLSFGRTAACCVKAKSVPLADAAATAIGNRIRSRKEIQAALGAGMKIEGVLGMVVIFEDQLGVIGEMHMEDA
jgi:hypothetical protein